MAGIHRDLEHLHTSYNAFAERNNEFDESDNESPPQFHESGHPSTWFQASSSTHMPKLNKSKPHEHDPPAGGVIIHTVAEENKSRWSHIEDLDSFFKNIYTYHQKHGFRVMLFQVIYCVYISSNRKDISSWFIIYLSEGFRASPNCIHPVPVSVPF